MRRGRADVASRCAAAVLGGYMATAAVSAVLARALPLDRPDATAVATLMSFFVYAGVALWVFTASTAARAWLIVASPAAACALLLVWLAPKPA